MASVNLDTTNRLDITCRKGDTFSLQLTLTDSSGTALPLATDDYKFLMQVRTRGNNRRAALRVPALIGGGEDDLDLTGGIAIGSSELGVKGPVNFSFNDKNDSGQVTIFLSANDMRKVDAGRYRYDLQYKVGDTEKTVLEGSFVINEDVSKNL